MTAEASAEYFFKNTIFGMVFFSLSSDERKTIPGGNLKALLRL